MNRFGLRTFRFRRFQSAVWLSLLNRYTVVWNTRWMRVSRGSMKGRRVAIWWWCWMVGPLRVRGVPIVIWGRRPLICVCTITILYLHNLDLPYLRSRTGEKDLKTANSWSHSFVRIWHFQTGARRGTNCNDCVIMV